MEKVLRKKETERGKGGQSGEEEESLCYEPVDIFEHRSLLTHKSHVTCLYIDCTGLISGSRDKMLVWQNFWKEI